MTPTTQAATDVSTGAAATRLLAAACLCALLAWLGLENGFTSSRAPFPFAWWDVLLVQLVGAIPIAALLAGAALRSPIRALAMAGVALLIGSAVFSLDLGVATFMRTEVPGGAALVRALAALLIAGAAATAVVPARFRASKPALALAVIALAVPPALYVEARVQRGIQNLGAMVEQERVGAAAALAEALAMLAPRGQWREHPLPEVAAKLDGAVRRLEARVAAGLAPGAGGAELLRHATTLAMLGRDAEALEVSAAIDERALAMDVANLRGTIFESREQWPEALRAFETAQTLSADRPPSPDRAAALVRATTGVAYAQRKLGDYAAAEASYQAILALAPTADSHFLLAQFYDHTQQTGEARDHARQAMKLDPGRYQRQGEKLLNQLAQFHFGCLSVGGR